MDIKKASFVISNNNINNLKIKRLDEIAFVGRSNVGKSSFINMLVNNKKLAKTSSMPGRTRLINYFLINDSFYFVDLPGYGFAKASKTEVSNWQSIIEPYLLENKFLKCVCVLLDIRHKPSLDDLDMISFLEHYKIAYIIVATKCDKLPKTKIKPQIQNLANLLNIGRDNIYAVSNQNAYGKNEVLLKFEQFLQ